MCKLHSRIRGGGEAATHFFTGASAGKGGSALSGILRNRLTRRTSHPASIRHRLAGGVTHLQTVLQSWIFCIHHHSHVPDRKWENNQVSLALHFKATIGQHDLNVLRPSLLGHLRPWHRALVASIFMGVDSCPRIETSLTSCYLGTGITCTPMTLRHRAMWEVEHRTDGTQIVLLSIST